MIPSLGISAKFLFGTSVQHIAVVMIISSHALSFFAVATMYCSSANNVKAFAGTLILWKINFCLTSLLSNRIILNVIHVWLS